MWETERLIRSTRNGSTQLDSDRARSHAHRNYFALPLSRATSFTCVCVYTQTRSLTEPTGTPLTCKKILAKKSPPPSPLRPAVPASALLACVELSVFWEKSVSKAAPHQPHYPVVCASLSNWPRPRRHNNALNQVKEQARKHRVLSQSCM